MLLLYTAPSRSDSAAGCKLYKPSLVSKWQPQNSVWWEENRNREQRALMHSSRTRHRHAIHWDWTSGWQTFGPIYFLKVCALTVYTVLNYFKTDDVSLFWLFGWRKPSYCLYCDKQILANNISLLYIRLYKNSISTTVMLIITAFPVTAIIKYCTWCHVSPREATRLKRDLTQL